MKLLVTGGAGFIGSNFIRYVLTTYKEWTVVNLDKLTYAGNLENLVDVAQGASADRYRFIRGDIADRALVEEIFSTGFDAVINFAAESHVDRSIDNAHVFIQTNVLGTQVLLDSALRHKVQRFVQISTDEVYGSLGPEGYFTETTPLAPNSPYSASKAGADLLVRAYYETFRLPTIITRCSNNYGPYQFPEKLIPLFITNALHDQPLPLYGDGLNVRDWIYVEDHCAAIALILERGRPGEVYNIGGNSEKTNIEITRAILHRLGKPESLIRYVTDRPGHDRRYAIDSSKLQRELGWAPRYDFATGIDRTIRWYLENTAWWQRIKTGEYLDFYNRWYGNRI
ncbi:MAG: dTDP-glucose 4,6-dehydratase [Desulfobacterota bacterium]|nr:dTDP-glucose 4,6-dehydratase [Thermodesulfobacteriota bacterium]